MVHDSCITHVLKTKLKLFVLRCFNVGNDDFKCGFYIYCTTFIGFNFPNAFPISVNICQSIYSFTVPCKAPTFTIFCKRLHDC
jgi:hypothetical protein